MSDRIEITVQGRLGADPVRRVGASGNVWATFRLGSTPTSRDPHTGAFRDGRTEWFTVKTWGNLAANVLESLHRATPVIVRGKVYVDVWSGEKGERWDHVIYADAVAVEMSAGTVRFVRTIRETPATPGPAEPATVTGPDGARWDSDDLPDDEPPAESEAVVEPPAEDDADATDDARPGSLTAAGLGSLS